VSAAYAGPPSNPAFLGIAMIDARTLVAMDGCMIEQVTPSSGAEAAGLRINDIIRALDGVPTASCQQLSAAIVEHAPGEVIHLDIQRGVEHLVAHATLSTRAEILHARFVGHPLDPTEATDVDDGHSFDLAELRGDTTILAWFDVQHCAGCSSLIRRVGDLVQAPRRDEPPARMLALTYGLPDDVSGYRTNLNLGVPLATVGGEDYQRAATSDVDRVFFMVLDCHGTVRFVTPIAPEDDALDAAIDEVTAAAEQAEHACSRR
jgi:hypothetical protein